MRFAVAAAVIAGAVMLGRSLDLRRLAETLRSTAWSMVALACVMNLGPNTCARALRWRALLPAPAPHHRRAPKLVDLAAAVLAGQAANTALPLRGGEVVRAVVLRERDREVPVPAIVGSQIAEKLVEVGSLVAVTLPVLTTPWAAKHAGLAAYVAAGVGLVVSIATAIGKLGASGKIAVFARLRARAPDMFPLGPKAWLASLAWAIASDAIDLGMVAACAAAVGLTVPLAVWCAVLLAVNVGASVPTTPGSVGPHEAASVFALMSAGAEADHALAFALVYHGAHFVPTTLAGLVALALTKGRAKHAKKEDAS
jgi:hypothetical protein